MTGVEATAIGGGIVGLFGIIHALQNHRLSKLEDSQVGKDMCKTVSESIKKELAELRTAVAPVAEMRPMVKFLYDDKIKFLKRNGHNVEDG